MQAVLPRSQSLLSHPCELLRALLTAGLTIHFEEETTVDAERFDDLLRFVTLGASRRGVLAVLAGGLLVTLPLAQDGGNAEARNKKKRQRKKKQKQQPIPAIPATPPADCIPNCGGNTCGGDGCGGSCGGCGANQACQDGACVCACPAGRLCLSNGSCATVCDELADCATGCSCNGPNIEGTKTCAAPGFTCEGFPQVCADTAACPSGQTCQLSGCGQGGSVENRCVPLCAG